MLFVFLETSLNLQKGTCMYSIGQKRVDGGKIRTVKTGYRASFPEEVRAVEGDLSCIRSLLPFLLSSYASQRMHLSKMPG